MKIKILGTGCPKCETLYKTAEKAARLSDSEFELEKITDINQIISYGVMMTPALVINDKVEPVGNIASVEEITAIINKKKEA